MFSSQVKLYLKAINLKSEDDKRLATLRFFLTPITYELATEVSPNVADRLFRKNGNKYEPALELGRTELLFRPNGAFSMFYRRHPEYNGHQVHVPDVSIANISAQKVIPGDPNFSLIFETDFEINDKTVVTDLVDLLHENFYVSFEAMQPALFPDKNEWEGLLCRLCDAPNPEWGVEGSKPKIAYCSKCKGQKMDDEQLIRIADHDKAAAAAKNGSEEGTDSPPEEKKGTDPLFAGADINERASKRQRKGRVN